MDSFKPMQEEHKFKQFCLQHNVQTRHGSKIYMCYVIMHKGPLVKS